MSTGFETAASMGRNDRSAAWVAADSSGTLNPCPAQASAARTPGPPALATSPTRPPRGSGWRASTSATSKSSSVLSTRMTPVWRNSASTTSSELARAAVCEAAPRVPGALRPLLTATIGLFPLTRRAIRLNLRGLPKDSR